MMGYEDDFSSDEDDSGSEIMRCPHGLEHCGACCVDYTDINEAAREAAFSEGAAKTLDIKNHVPLGTKCKLIDCSGRSHAEDLIGKVIGSRMAVDEMMDESVPHYVIEVEKDGERFKHRIDDFHEEFLVWKDGKWEQPVPLDS
eukprot:jgi/Ulvmu1/9062/UM005_0155.1